MSNNNFRIEIDMTQFDNMTRIAQHVIDELMEDIGLFIVEEVDSNFRHGWFRGDGGTTPWKPSNNGKSPLIGTGNLRRSIGIKYLSEDTVIVGPQHESISKYAEIHNEGGTINITEQMRKFFWAMWYQEGNVFWKRMALKKDMIIIPQRQFIGESQWLENEIAKLVDLKLGSIDNDKTTYVGARGGLYTLDSKGGRVYIKK